MKKNIFIVLLCFFFVSSCSDDNSTNPLEENKTIIATGSYYNPNIDKNEYGDFLLVLALEKSSFTNEESKNIKLYFKNIGSKKITLDGILPYSQSANPPRITIWSTDNTSRFEVFEILSGLLNNNKIIVDIGKSVMLMSFDLSNVSGFSLENDTNGIGYTAKELENIYSNFNKGPYNITADFWPSPGVYYSQTDTIIFNIN